MPYEIKVFDGEFSSEATEEIIKAVTDAMVSFTGENIRSATWVVVQEVKSGNWGIGGKALGLQDVRTIEDGPTKYKAVVPAVQKHSRDTDGSLWTVPDVG